MKKLLLMFTMLTSMQPETSAFSFSDAINAVKHAVEGGVSQSSGASSNTQAISQLKTMIDQYQTALQNDQAALQQEASIIAAQQNTIMRGEIEKAMYLHLLPYAPPVSDPAVYYLLVLISLLNLFNRNGSYDQKTALSNAFTRDQYVRLAKTLIPLTPADEQKMINQYLAALPPVWAD